MEIPDSDDEEEILPPTPEKEPENNSQETNPARQFKTNSTTQFVERILTQLNLVGIQNQHQQGQKQEQEQERRDRDNAQENKQNPLSALPPSALSQAKPLLLTLHCLLPNELLPALDILDRGLVRRLVLRNKGDSSGSDSDQEEKDSESPSLMRSTAESPCHEDIFFVLSVSEHDKRGHEVRLQAWNCTCASFLCSAFPLDTDSDTDSEPGTDRHIDVDINPLGGQENCRLGGALTHVLGQSFPPLCKHMLACVLLVRCPGLFVSGSQTWLVNDQELAAWCAGWGD